MARWRGGILARWREVDGLLEKGAIERIGLIEDREHAQLATREQPLQREFAAFDERLHLQEMVLIFVKPRDVGIGQKLFNAAESNAEFGGVIGANDAPAGGKS